MWDPPWLHVHLPHCSRESAPKALTACSQPLLQLLAASALLSCLPTGIGPFPVLALTCFLCYLAVFAAIIRLPSHLMARGPLQCFGTVLGHACPASWETLPERCGLFLCWAHPPTQQKNLASTRGLISSLCVTATAEHWGLSVRVRSAYDFRWSHSGLPGRLGSQILFSKVCHAQAMTEASSWCPTLAKSPFLSWHSEIAHPFLDISQLDTFQGFKIPTWVALVNASPRDTNSRCGTLTCKSFS